MNEKDSHRIHRFYTTALKEYGNQSPKSVHWTTSHGQIRRFDILLDVEDVSNSSVLDVGCGLGDFYQTISELKEGVKYTGIDIIPEFIHGAKKRFPEATFLEKDIFDVQEYFDVILSSGALSFKVDKHKDYYFAMIRKMYGLAERAVAFNMLESGKHRDNETYATYSPREVADFCGTFASRVEIAIGYLPQDFTVYLYKEKV